MYLMQQTGRDRTLECSSLINQPVHKAEEVSKSVTGYSEIHMYSHSKSMQKTCVHRQNLLIPSILETGWKEKCPTLAFNSCCIGNS